MHDPLKKPSTAGRIRRRHRRAAGLPPNAACATCGATTVAALSLMPGGAVTCYACRARARGGSGYEDHHLFGRAVDPAVLRVPANIHRVLESAKYDWPAAVLHNTDRRPALLLAGFLLFLRDLGQALMIHCQAFAEWLLRLHARLLAQSPDYEQSLELLALFGEG